MGVNSKLFVQDPLPNEFECPICKDALQVPYITIECQHYFCKHCLEQSLQNNSSCPMCRTSLEKDEEDHDDDDGEENIVVPVRVEQYKNCLRQPDKYFRRKLGELKLTCSFDECTAVVEYSDLRKHQKSCTFNPETRTACQYCNGTWKRKHLPLHLKKCGEYRLFKFKQSFDKQLDELRQENTELTERVQALEQKCCGTKRCASRMSQTDEGLEENSPCSTPKTFKYNFQN
jgi:hypothetical protein